jgi:hypothetical protein
MLAGSADAPKRARIARGVRVVLALELLDHIRHRRSSKSSTRSIVLLDKTISQLTPRPLLGLFVLADTETCPDNYVLISPNMAQRHALP